MPKQNLCNITGDVSERLICCPVLSVIFWTTVVLYVSTRDICERFMCCSYLSEIFVNDCYAFHISTDVLPIYVRDICERLDVLSTSIRDICERLICCPRYLWTTVMLSISRLMCCLYLSEIFLNGWCAVHICPIYLWTTWYAVYIHPRYLWKTWCAVHIRPRYLWTTWCAVHIRPRYLWTTDVLSITVRKIEYTDPPLH